MTMTIVLIIGFSLGFLAAATLAGFIWINKAHAWDHEPTEEELRAKLGEVWN